MPLMVISKQITGYYITLTIIIVIDHENLLHPYYITVRSGYWLYKQISPLLQSKCREEAGAEKPLPVYAFVRGAKANRLRAIATTNKQIH